VSSIDDVSLNDFLDDDESIIEDKNIKKKKLQKNNSLVVPKINNTKNINQSRLNELPDSELQNMYRNNKPALNHPYYANRFPNYDGQKHPMQIHPRYINMTNDIQPHIPPESMYNYTMPATDSQIQHPIEQTPHTPAGLDVIKNFFIELVSDLNNLNPNCGLWGYIQVLLDKNRLFYIGLLCILMYFLILFLKQLFALIGQLATYSGSSGGGCGNSCGNVSRCMTSCSSHRCC
jgi:hypothetical protein